MTPAQILLIPIAALMAADMALTAKGLALGYSEMNFLAAPLMTRLGAVRGMLAYEAGLLTITAALVLLFPMQWAMPAALVLELSITVERNRRLIRNSALREG